MMHVRALCHATEKLESVKQTVLNVIGEAELQVSHTSGHHGNEILIVEARVEDAQRGLELFHKLSDSDKEMVLNTLEKRVDESCNLFLRVDKQAAFRGKMTLAQNDDAIAVRMKVTAYPAKKEIVVRMLRDMLENAEERRTRAPAP